MTDSGDGEKRESPLRRRWLYGAAVLFCLLMLILWLGREPGAAPAAPVSPRADIGIVDVDLALAAHPAYGALEEQRQEQQRLAAELRAERQLLLALRPPRLPEGFLADSVRQKQHQKDVEARGALLDQLAAALEARRRELQPALEEKRDAINRQYVHEIFNIQLKLDNRDSMKLSPQMVEEMTERLRELQRQRGEKQRALAEEFEAGIEAYRQALAAEMGLELSRAAASSREQLEAEALRREAQIQLRNVAAAQEGLMAAAERRFRLEELRLALQTKGQEVAAMEEQMMLEVASRVSKLAVLHRLSVVLAWPAKSIEPPAGGGLSALVRPPLTAPLVNVAGVDLTEELIREMKGH